MLPDDPMEHHKVEESIDYWMKGFLAIPTTDGKSASDGKV